MAKEKPKSLLDDVLAKNLRNRPGFQTWFDRLTPEQQAEMRAVHDAFDPSQHQKLAYARAVLEAARERGIPTSGLQGVIAWLKRPL